MKKFTIQCNFNDQKAPFDIYIGAPEGVHHPLHFQADWLSKERGGTIPQELMDAIAKLNDLSKKNGVLLPELCVYALGSAQSSSSSQLEEEDEIQDSESFDEEESEEEAITNSDDE